ncbi:TraB/GumN family protein [Altericroceibacterium endophyticum]|uniref:TraB/GumN family protein n=1 Tax=Altericroceibacterium endophyticum TaxID=1808508 RepID=A0A6I4T2T8_9SPHN|nr:TraB/GumN family protein [Altericroceibacterium endophyticum]MXO64433.1 TraB/GumN family protein [Altericroceibacterium endophyticum]
MSLKSLLLPLAGSLSMILGVTACAAEPLEIPENLAETDIEEGHQGPALWALSDDDTTVYLFGTVHVLPEDVKWFGGAIAEAFQSSDELVTEIDMNDAAAMQQLVMSKAILPADAPTLREQMSDENREQYEAAMVTLGLPVEALDRFEPWYAAMTLQLLPMVQAGYGANSGVDAVLTAKAADKQRAALETPDEQISLFDEMSPDTQLAFLDQTVESLPGMMDTIDAMVGEWLAGDADDLARIMNGELDDPALYKRLLTDRNAHWADWIEERMQQPGTVFIAVGAGHLAGENSVQAQLAQRGLPTRRITH